MRLLVISLILIILIIPLALARSDTINLLTVSDLEENIGGTATIKLEITSGTGKIFIDSYPLTKLDTQISTRYANQIACDYLKENCQNYDFYYTIRADANIVGGPSAGAAITVLTVSVLEGEKLDKKTVMTGTINSGGLIGPVAGLEPKIDAAIKHDFERVLIPKWQSDINLTSIKKNNPTKSITIVKVKNLDEALVYFTGIKRKETTKELEISESYSEKMNEIANKLCLRSKTLTSEIEDQNTELFNRSQEFLNQSKQTEDNHYSRASYCFSANLRLKEQVLKESSEEKIKELLTQTRINYDEFEQNILARKKTTISELQTYIVVMERLNQAKDSLDLIEEDNISISLLAYGSERFYSAQIWAEFFELEGQEINLDEKHLKDACIRKTAEAEERISYIELYVPAEFVEGMRSNLDDAFNEYRKKDYAFCIFKAGKAKAEANMMLTILTIKEDELEMVLLEKFESIKKIIIEQEEIGMFPILGYSYYEYATSLLDHDIISSLTFTEYALEFNRLDLYFPLETNRRIISDFSSFRMFLAGFIAGILVLRIFNRKKNPGRFQEIRNLPGKKR